LVTVIGNGLTASGWKFSSRPAALNDSLDFPFEPSPVTESLVKMAGADDWTFGMEFREPPTNDVGRNTGWIISYKTNSQEAALQTGLIRAGRPGIGSWFGNSRFAINRDIPSNTIRLVMPEKN
jgi:hypothetical protein